ncbi:MAG: DsbA family protein [Bryobacteraceae bacterium]
MTASAGQASQEEILSPTMGKRWCGTVHDVTIDPFAADRAKIRTELAPSFGPVEAPVSITIYSDFQCSYCKEEATVIRQNMGASFAKQVRVYFKDFPLDAIHPWARTAAIAGRCIFRQKPDTFWDYHDWIFEKQGEVTLENVKAKVLEFAKGKPIETIQLSACIDGKSTESEVEKSMIEARTLGVNSTPTLFINGRRLVGNISWQQMKAIIEHEIEYQKRMAAVKNAAKSSCRLR